MCKYQSVPYQQRYNNINTHVFSLYLNLFQLWIWYVTYWVFAWEVIKFSMKSKTIYYMCI